MKAKPIKWLVFIVYLNKLYLTNLLKSLLKTNYWLKNYQLKRLSCSGRVATDAVHASYSYFNIFLEIKYAT